MSGCVIILAKSPSWGGGNTHSSAYLTQQIIHAGLKAILVLVDNQTHEQRPIDWADYDLTESDVRRVEFDLNALIELGTSLDVRSIIASATDLDELAYDAAHALGVPYSVIVRDDVFDESIPYGKRTPEILAAAQYVACVSPHMIAPLNALGVQQTVLLPRPGPAASSDIEKQSIKRGAVPQLIYVGQFEARKNVRLLPAIAEQVVRRLNTGIVMTLIGNGPQYAEVVAALAHMPNCRVRALGWLSRSEVIGELSRNSDFLLLPSQAGGRPHVVLEALATATAPIISDIPAHRALLQIEHDSDPALRWLWPPGACERAVELIAGLWENVAKEKAFWRDYSRVALDTQNVFAEGVRIMTAGFGAWPATPTLTAARLGPAATIEYSNPHHAI